MKAGNTMAHGIEELNAVQRIMKNGVLSDYKGSWSPEFYGGAEIKALEQEWAKYIGVKHAIACNSDTSALYVSCAAIGLKPGDEVLVTPFSMTCSATMPLLFGAVPVFVDIEDEYFNMDPDKVEAAITPRTKAIIVVNLFGHPYDADRINAIARKYDLKVIEDSAQAPSALYKGKMCGSLGDIGTFSFNYHKHIHAGEGGMLTTNDDELAFKLRLMINHAEAVMNGIEDEHVLDYDNSYYKMVGMNLRMTELQAGIMREQLKKLPSLIKQYQQYGWLLHIPVMPECTSSFYRYALMNENGYNLEDLNPDPNTFDIKKHYITPLHRMPVFARRGYDEDCCPVADEVNKNIVLIWHKKPL